MVRVRFDVGIRTIDGGPDRVDTIDGKVRNRDPDKKPVQVVVNRDDNIVDMVEATKNISSVVNYSLERIGPLREQKFGERGWEDEGDRGTSDIRGLLQLRGEHLRRKVYCKAVN